MAGVEGCFSKVGGISDGCKNCCALDKEVRQTGRSDRAGERARKVIRRVDHPEYNRWWNGKLHFDSEAIRKSMLRAKANKKREMLCTYSGDIAAFDPEHMACIFQIMHEIRGVRVVFLSKMLKLLCRKMVTGAAIAVESGINPFKLRNIRVGASIESPKYLYRIDHLREFPVMWPREVWLKPLLEPISAEELSLEGISLCRVNGEKNSRNSKIDTRPFDMKWVDEIRFVGWRDNCKVIKEK